MHSSSCVTAESISTCVDILVSLPYMWICSSKEVKKRSRSFVPRALELDHMPTSWTHVQHYDLYRRYGLSGSTLFPTRSNCSEGAPENHGRLYQKLKLSLTPLIHQCHHNQTQVADHWKPHIMPPLWCDASVLQPRTLALHQTIA